MSATATTPLKLAFFSPFNPQKSGISDYSEELLPYLAKGASIDLFVEGFKPSNRELRRAFQLFDYVKDSTVLNRLREYNAIVYHMGNNHRYHEGIYDVARVHPGIIVLHDFAVHDFFFKLALARGDHNFYLEEVQACYGAAMRDEVDEELVRGATPTILADPLLFPLNNRLVNSAEAIIVHSEWSRARLQAIAPAVPLAHINLHVAPQAGKDTTAALTRRVGKRKVEIASFGFVTTEKGIERVLRALAVLSSDHDFHYTLVGGAEGYDVMGAVRRFNLANRVSLTGYVSMREFAGYIAKTDIAINLRERTVGESSSSVCRLMGNGVPTIVSDIGWYAELPDDAVIKIKIGEQSDELLRANLKNLIEDAALRQQIGQNARHYMLTAHNIERSAAEYLAFIREIVEERTRRNFIREVSRELARLGIDESDEVFLSDIASEVNCLTTIARVE